MSNRELTTEQRAIMAAPIVRYTNLIRIAYPGLTLRANTGNYDLELMDQTWVGAGKVGAVSAIVESTDLSVIGAQFTLTGVPMEFLAEVLTATSQQAPTEIFVAVFNDDMSAALVKLVYYGYIDQFITHMGADSFNVQARAENWGMRFKRLKPRRLNGATQRALYPDDTGLNNVERASVTKIIFPSAAWQRENRVSA